MIAAITETATMPPMAPPERPLVEVLAWDAPLVGEAEPVTVLETVRVPTKELPLLSADGPLEGGGVMDGFAVDEAAEALLAELEFAEEVEAPEEDAADEVSVEVLVWVEVVCVCVFDCWTGAGVDALAGAFVLCMGTSTVATFVSRIVVNGSATLLTMVVALWVKPGGASLPAMPPSPGISSKSSSSSPAEPNPRIPGLRAKGFSCAKGGASLLEEGSRANWRRCRCPRAAGAKWFEDIVVAVRA